ncbi:Uncharacterized protein Adt_23664 [Abeliophyllum distichum]|uniref:Uncharacterized protein n=1 Tax=Abeliophyllum distichum TaxID=126358 RepID=A0ABD1SES8_9LAMI
MQVEDIILGSLSPTVREIYSATVGKSTRMSLRLHSTKPQTKASLSVSVIISNNRLKNNQCLRKEQKLWLSMSGHPPPFSAKICVQKETRPRTIHLIHEHLFVELGKLLCFQTTYHLLPNYGRIPPQGSVHTPLVVIAQN